MGYPADQLPDSGDSHSSPTFAVAENADRQKGPLDAIRTDDGGLWDIHSDEYDASLSHNVEQDQLQ